MNITKIACALSRASASGIVKESAFEVEPNPLKWQWPGDLVAGSHIGLGVGVGGLGITPDVASRMDTSDLQLAHAANHKAQQQMAANEALASSGNHTRAMYEGGAKALAEAREWIKKHQGLAVGAGIGAGALGAAGLYYAGKGIKHRNDDEE